MGLFRKKNREPEEIRLDEIDRESKYKIFSPAGDKVLTAVLTCFTLFQLYASISNKVPLQILRYTHLGFAICLAYLIYPAFKHSDRSKESRVCDLPRVPYLSGVQTLRPEQGTMV